MTDTDRPTVPDFLGRFFVDLAPLTVREDDDGDGRTVHGLAVPYDTEVEVRDWEGAYREVFRIGAFAKTIKERGHKVKLLDSHKRYSDPIGRAVALEERSDGLYGAFRIAQTARGDEIIQLIRDGALDSFSVGFRPQRTRWSDLNDEIKGLRKDYVRRREDGSLVLAERTEVRLDETSVVPFPAYDDAEIVGVRTRSPERAADTATDADTRPEGRAVTSLSITTRRRLAAYRKA